MDADSRWPLTVEDSLKTVADPGIGQDQGQNSGNTNSDRSHIEKLGKVYVMVQIQHMLQIIRQQCDTVVKNDLEDTKNAQWTFGASTCSISSD